MLARLSESCSSSSGAQLEFLKASRPSLCECSTWNILTESKDGNPITVNDLNDSGEIVGGGQFPGRPFDAYLWKNGCVAVDLGALDGDLFQ